MDLSTITVDRQAAREAVAAYRRALHNEKHEQLRAEDEAILRGYREISRGHPIISIRDVIHAGGETSRFLPKLGISRADEKRLEVRRRRDGSVRFGVNLGFHPARAVTLLPPGTLSSMGWQRWSRPEAANGSSEIRASAIVPTIPPEFRPNANLERYWILFEAEWTNVAPKDPALLRALGGGLFAVLATWDLTDLERAVLGMTRAE
jgi:hypothetical protein